jgi:hypothetical protein
MYGINKPKPIKYHIIHYIVRYIVKYYIFGIFYFMYLSFTLIQIMLLSVAYNKIE